MTMSIGDGVFLSVFDNLKCNHSIKSLPVLLKPSIFLVHIYLLKMKYFFKNIETLEMVCYNFCVAHRYPATGGGDFMSIFISFLVTVAAGVACHYIIKWLDSNDKGNKQPTGFFSSINKKKNPSTMVASRLRDSFFDFMLYSYLFAQWHYIICR